MLYKPTDVSNFGLQVETREDEEQSVKLAEILELLLAAGYFRARIKGLGPFDKVSTSNLRRGGQGQPSSLLAADSFRFPVYHLLATL